MQSDRQLRRQACLITCCFGEQHNTEVSKVLNKAVAVAVPVRSSGTQNNNLTSKLGTCNNNIGNNSSVCRLLPAVGRCSDKDHNSRVVLNT